MKLSMLARGIVATLSTVIFVGCERNASSGSAHVTFQVPTQINEKSGTSSSSSRILKHIVAQATSADIPDKIHSILSSDHQAVTADMTLEIPSGDNRLIQLFAVFEDPATDQKWLYYGDVKTSLKGGTVTLEIPLSRLGTAAFDTDSDLKGRILTSASSGPTGDLQVVYKPTGKPSLLVKSDPILAGWFSSFVFDEIPMDYILPDGSAIFTQAITSSFSVSAYVAKINQPESYWRDYSQAGEEYKKNQASSSIVGYFAKDASLVSAKKICVSAVTPLNQGTLSLEFAHVQPSRLTPLTVKHNPAPATPSTSNSRQVVINGGLALSGCGHLNPNEEFVNYLRWEPLGYMMNGQMINWKDFYGTIDWTRASVESQFSGSSFVPYRSFEKNLSESSGLNHKTLLLPGVADTLDGLEFYYSTQQGNSQNHMSDCEPQRLKEEGWVFAKSRGREFFTSDAVAISMANIIALSLPNSSQWAYCLTRKGKPTGSLIHLSNILGELPNQINFQFPTFQPINGQCIPLAVGLSRFSIEYYVYNPLQTTTVSVSSHLRTSGTMPIAILHTSPTCSDTATYTKDLVITNPATRAVFYYRPTSASSFDFVVDSVTGGLTPPTALTVTAINQPTGLDSFEFTRATNSNDFQEVVSLPANTCVPVKLTSKLSGVVSTISEMVNMGFYELDQSTPYTLPTGMRVVNNCISLTTIAGPEIQFTSQSSRDFAIVTGDTAAENFVMKFHAATSAISSYKRLNIVPVVHHLRPMLKTGFVPNPNEGLCQAIEYKVYDKDGSLSTVPAGKQVRFSPTRTSNNFPPSMAFDSRFYASSSACNANSATVAEVSIAAGGSMATVWTKSFGAGAFGLSYFSESASVSNPDLNNYLAAILNLNLVPYMEFLNAPASLPPSTTQVLAFQGGQAPYVATITAGGGSVTVVSESYPKQIEVTTPPGSGSMTILITDSTGLSVTHLLTH